MLLDHDAEVNLQEKNHSRNTPLHEAAREGHVGTVELLLAAGGRYVVFQLAEVAVSRALFAEILRRIDGLQLRAPQLQA